MGDDLRKAKGAMTLLRKHSRSLVYAARLSLGCVFLASSLPKVRQPYDFLADVYKYQLTGLAWSHFIAMVLPFLELTLAVCLLGGLVVGGSFLLSGLLTLMFAAAQISALVRGLPIACGCFGSLVSSELVGYGTLARLALMFAAAAMGLWAQRYATEPPPLKAAPAEPEASYA
jgi:hypothetical protein